MADNPLMTLHPVLREGLALHEMLRKLHFPAENIFAGVTDNAIDRRTMFVKPSRTLVVQLQHDGKEFNATVGQVPWDGDEFEAKWTEAVMLWNHVTHEQAMEMYDSCDFPAQGMALVVALKSKGFNFSDGLG